MSLLRVLGKTFTFCPPEMTREREERYLAMEGLRCSRGVYFRVFEPRRLLTKKVLIVAGGRSSDLLDNSEMLRGFCEALGARVVGFDYHGYGLSGDPGSCDEAGCYSSLEEITCSFSGKELTLMGISLGSAVVCGYCSEHPEHTSPVALVTPFLSIAKIVFGNLSLLADMFPVHEFLPKMKCAARVVIAEKDELIPAYHAREVCSLLGSRLLGVLQLPCKHGEVFQTCSVERVLDGVF